MTIKARPRLQAKSQRVVEMTWTRPGPLTLEDLKLFLEDCRELGGDEEDPITLTEDNAFFYLKWVKDGTSY